MLVTSLSADAIDLAVDDGRIADIGPDLSGRQEIDATGLLVFPGVIDAHTHMDLPVAGTRSCDDFYVGTRSAVCGGVTTIVDFTVGTPDRSIPEAIDARKIDAVRSVVDYAFHGEVVGWRPGREAEFADAEGLGVTSFKFYTAYAASGRRTPPEVMRPAFRELARLGAVALVHAEDEGLIESIGRRLTPEERSRMRTLAVARPALCEQSAISKTARIARETGCRVHFVHVSSGIGLDAVRSGRADGARITAETCPQYLLLTKEVYDREDGRFFSASPALRTDADRQALWTGLRHRDLDLIATDHCPFTREQKAWRGSFDQLPYGLPGVETLLPLAFSEGVAAGPLTPCDLARLLAEDPARIYGLYPAKGALEVGSDADLVLFDPEERWTISAEGLHGCCDFSPYEGRTVRGRVCVTLSRGDVVYDRGQVTDEAGRGRFLRCAPPAVER
jgi:dihydropyrimidinase